MNGMTTLRGRGRGVVRGLLAAGALVLLACAFTASVANADFGVRPDPNDASRLDFMADVFKADHVTPETRAGAAPADAVTAFGFNRLPDDVTPDEAVKNIAVDLPPGLVGNPQALPMCTRVAFNGTGINDAPCPANTQAGIVEARVRSSAGAVAVYTVPVYSLQPREGDVAEFAFRIVTTSVHIVASVEGSGADTHIRARILNVPETLPVLRTRLTLWGIPADPSHNAERKRSCTGTEADILKTCVSGNQASDAWPRAFWRNPTLCGPPVTTELRVDSWLRPGVQNPAIGGAPYRALSTSGATGCENLRFEPSIRVKPDNTKAGAPTGLKVDISVPQSQDPRDLATPHLRKAVVRLPEGMVVSPSSADGLGACSDEQVGVGSTDAARCPDSANLGTVQIDTPVLARPLQGTIYLGTQTPSQLLRLFLVVDDQGVVLKLPGTVDPDPVTGQLTATFDDNPQLPFTNLSLHFKDGPRAALSNPPTCGVKTTTTSLTAYSGQTATPSDSFEITADGSGAPCPPRGFAPGFRAGMLNPVGGANSTFSLTFSRSDADEELRDITVDMPQGLLARIASTDLCDEAAAATGTCGENTRVGSTTTGAGPGSQPFFLPGRVYLGGPYKGAPFNLSIVVPAVAGPFNLGTVVVRAAVFVDRSTTALRIVSDPLPSILMGIPLQIRTVNISIDRPGFMINPTSCSVKRINALISSLHGATSGTSSRFQVGSCSALPFKPNMKLKIGARGRTKSGLTTPFEATITQKAGQANLKGVQVTLPRTLNSRLEVLSDRVACSLDQFNSDRCVTGVGTATAVTPLLRDPLRGNVYLVRNPERRLPDLVVALKGQVNVDVVGKVTIVPGSLALRTDFDTVPDVPITSFSLRLVAGSRGPIGIINGLCTRVGKNSPATVRMRGQNGKLVKVSQKLAVSGCGRAKSKKATSRNKKANSRSKQTKRK